MESAKVEVGSAANAPLAPFGCRWAHTALRIKDPQRSIAFYKLFGMRLLERRDFPHKHYTWFFLDRPITAPLGIISSPQLHRAADTPNVVLTLVHEHGTEKSNYTVNNGNEEPHRGFGHIAFDCTNLKDAVNYLIENGVTFKKTPEQGIMRNIAFAYDPDKYWVELCVRPNKAFPQEQFNLSQTMLRVKEPQRSLDFYTNVLGMICIKKSVKDTFSLYFLKSPREDPAIADWGPALELTHNHGTENDSEQVYHTGNEPPTGYSHMAFFVEDLATFCTKIPPETKWIRELDCDRLGVGVAIADPDGYHVVLLQQDISYQDQPIRAPSEVASDVPPVLSD